MRPPLLVRKDAGCHSVVGWVPVELLKPRECKAEELLRRERGHIAEVSCLVMEKGVILSCHSTTTGVMSPFGLLSQFAVEKA